MAILIVIVLFFAFWMTIHFVDQVMAENRRALRKPIVKIDLNAPIKQSDEYIAKVRSWGNTEYGK
jgi:fructose-specific phosphotransferase system component IIB